MDRTEFDSLKAEIRRQAKLKECEIRFYLFSARMYRGFGANRKSQVWELTVADLLYDDEVFYNATQGIPLPDYVVEARKFVYGVIYHERASTGPMELSFRMRFPFVPTPEGAAKLVEWLLAYDPVAVNLQADAEAAELKAELDDEQGAH